MCSILSYSEQQTSGTAVCACLRFEATCVLFDASCVPFGSRCCAFFFGALSPTTTAVDSGYDGPRLEDSGEVTMEFCEAMMARFQDSKLIHKK